jgi:hypothetical protein
LVRNELRRMRIAKYETPQKLKRFKVYIGVLGESEKDTQTEGVMCKWGGF